jgi:hypothetical protein
MNVIKFLTMKKVFLFLISGLVCTISMTSCSEENKGPGNVPLTDIRVDKESVEGNVRYDAASERIEFFPIPANATDVDFKLASADQSVATVESPSLGEGRITILKAGTTVVTVSSGQVTKEITVEGYIGVTPLVDIRLELDKEIDTETDSTLILVLPVGDVVEVIATADPRNANTETADYVTFDWKSSNTSVATVEVDATTVTAIDKTGKITVVGTGEAKITIRCAEEDDEEDEYIKAKTIIIKGVRANG